MIRNEVFLYHYSSHGWFSLWNRFTHLTKHKRYLTFSCISHTQKRLIFGFVLNVLALGDVPFLAQSAGAFMFSAVRLHLVLCSFWGCCHKQCTKRLCDWWSRLFSRAVMSSLLKGTFSIGQCHSWGLGLWDLSGLLSWCVLPPRHRRLTLLH